LIEYRMNPYAATYICTLFTVAINIYIVVPFMNMEFGEWLMAPIPAYMPVSISSTSSFPALSLSSLSLEAVLRTAHEMDRLARITLYRWLDTGLPRTGQTVVTIIYFSAFLICGLLDVGHS
jgi:hypothetical protein